MAIFNGTASNNTFIGSAADDTYHYGNVTYAVDGTTIGAARGFDTITTGGGFDRLVFANVGINHVYADRVGNDFKLYLQPTTDWDDADVTTTLGGVTILNMFAADGSGVIDRFVFTDAYVDVSYTSGIFRARIFTPGGTLVENNVDGSAGNDSIVGTAVVDYLNGMLGNDSLSGLGGHDELEGEDGNDLLNGGTGNDRLWGDNGNDRLVGAQGNDTMDGGNGIDTVEYATANSSITVNLGQFSARGVGAGSTVGIDTIYFAERVVGSAYADNLVGGGAGAVTLMGGAGNDTLIGGASSDSLVGGTGGDFFDASASGTTIGGLGDDTMDGGTVVDRINYLDGNAVSYASSNGSVTVNLQTGVALDGVSGKDTLRHINFVTGSSFGDRLTGSSASGFEMFTGGAGNDTIDGGLITDTLNGTTHNRAVFNTIQAAVVVDLATGTASGQGNDTLININQVRGSDLADTLRGSNRTDVVETLEGRGGNDVLNGRGGHDMARYQYATTGVSVNLATGNGFVVAGDQDTLAGIEGIRGSNHSDTLTGGNAANAALEFFRGMGGNDTIDGGAGYDRVEYVDSMQAVTVTLGGAGDGTAVDGTPILNGQIVYAGTAGAVVGTDTLRHIEAVRGSDFNDVLNGSGIATEETFEGRDGNDTINGGAGLDRASYHASLAGVTVTLGLSGAAGSAADGWGSTDTLRNIENVQGSRDFADRLTGNELANVLDGQGGNDTLAGGAGNDKLLGGSGHDLLIGGPGKDTLTGGSGLDLFRFATPLNATTNVEHLGDFVSADDTMQLDDAVFAGIGTPGTLTAGALRAGTAAGDAGDRIIYHSGTGQLFFDADGTGAISQVLFATVTAGTVIAASDFVII